MISTFDLGGDDWQLRCDDQPESVAATVPGTAYEAWQRAGRLPDPFFGVNERLYRELEDCSWEFFKTFDVPDPIRTAPHVELVFEGIDTVAEVFLNGEKIHTNSNMFVPAVISVGGLLREKGNTLAVKFPPLAGLLAAGREAFGSQEWMDPVGGSATIRKQASSFGWDWAPRLASSGIWRSVLLRGWTGARLQGVRVKQIHEGQNVCIEPQFTMVSDASDWEVRYDLTAPCGTIFVQDATAEAIDIPDPQLWWPKGHGAQPLYTLTCRLLLDGEVLDERSIRFGLRTLELDRSSYDGGQHFRFVVNGRPIFAKGANWIPAHVYPSSISTATYERLLRDAAHTHMNMLRVWGGGVYEDARFYDLCDSLGILVWQDFMFACALYPGSPEFLASVSAEADAVVASLAGRTCLALWCGNNELEMRSSEIASSPERLAAYEEIFHRILPEAVERLDGETPYWPSSPHNPLGWKERFNNPDAGDAHFWGVWHAGRPVKAYEETKFRFCSEFGMQSFPSQFVVRTFCDDPDPDPFSPTMECHQRNPNGNRIILDYLSRRYRFPRNYTDLAYLSQLNQAYTMKVGVEHFRRSAPRCMGALYWQLNDCWPGASWSGIEFDGRWKGLHYEAARFFAPTLITARILGEVGRNVLNEPTNTCHGAEIFLICDDPGPKRRLRAKWDLVHRRTGERVHGNKAVVEAKIGLVRLLASESFASHFAECAPEEFLLAMEASDPETGEILSANTALFSEPARMEFNRSPLRCESTTLDEKLRFQLSAEEHKHGVVISHPDPGVRFSDNFFDLLPGENREIEILAGSENQTSAPFTLRCYDLEERAV